MTPLQREALQMCLEYIETDAHERRHVRWKINEALAQPQQEPVAWMSDCAVGFRKSEFGATPTVPLYTAPPARKPLKDEEMYLAIRPLFRTDAFANAALELSKDEYQAIEAAHGIKGDA